VSTSSGLPVTVTTTTPAVCAVTTGVVHIVGAGVCTLTATQAGDHTYLAATPVGVSFSVTVATQTISFPAVADRRLGSPDFVVSPSASSGLPVTVTSQREFVCTVTNRVVHLVSEGTCILVADQDGDSRFTYADTVERTFQVTAGSTDGPGEGPGGTAASPAPGSQRIAKLLFRSGKYTLTRGQKVTVARVAAKVKYDGLSQLIVTSDTDSVGNRKVNMRRSVKRAKAVVTALRARGIPADVIVVRARGESTPVASNATKKGRAANRRVEIWAR
jgi:outer membrane protein OmpA-like peptidoglycan-associated protein